MTTFLVIAYPEFAAADLERIQHYRKDHDRLYFNVIKPHFTFVFPIAALPDFTTEIKKQVVGSKIISFTLRSATINKDAFSDYYHCFLVPDEGYGQMIKLHDRLYDGKLIINRRFDIDFIPHVNIGNSVEQWACKKMVDDWNATEFAISGTITFLDIISYGNGVVSTVEKIQLI